MTGGLAGADAKCQGSGASDQECAQVARLYCFEK